MAWGGGGQVEDPAVRAFVARDAHEGVTVLALLMLLWGAVYLAFERALPFWPFGATGIFLTAAAAVAFAYFGRTWRRPSARGAVAFSLVLVALLLIVIPWTGWAFVLRGRAWEAFPTSELATVGVVLVAPGSFWLGVVLVLLFQVELVALELYVQHLGLGAQLPAGGPLATLSFTVLGIGMLVLREQRRVRTRRYLQIRSETEALRHLGPLFDSVRQTLDAVLAALSSDLHRLRGPQELGLPLDRIDRAVERIGTVNRRLARLRSGEATAPAPLAQEAEDRFTAGDAHDGATICAAMMTLLFLIYGQSLRHVGFAHTALLAVGAAGLALISLAYLLAARRRPSERVALSIALAMFFLSLVIVSWGQTLYSSLDQPALPLRAHRVLMVTAPLVVATRFRISVGLVLVAGATAVALYFLLDLGAHKDLLPVVEPWSTLVFLVLALALVMIREQRRVASLRLFRSEWELAALHRQAGLYLALRDRLNSPLQLLVISVVQLEQKRPSADVAQIKARVEHLVAISRQLAAIERDHVSSATHQVSIDSDEVLRRRG